MHCDDSAFTIKVDVRDFNPEDLLVKVIGDFVEVQGKHEEKKVWYSEKNMTFYESLFTTWLYDLCSSLNVFICVLLEGWSRINNAAV